ncbi:MAG: HlyD family efflux transporter periplasmic adaptor subunit [Actinomycetota bacterium]
MSYSSNNSSSAVTTSPPEQSNLQQNSLAVNPQTLAANDVKDWFYGTEQLLDALPRRWTRSLLYLMIGFTAIVLPWAMLSKVDETGSARGRIEPFGATQRLDAPVSGTVTAVRVKEGQIVKAGQPLLELESDVLRTELQQSQNKLEGQQNRLAQLELLKNQVILSVRVQEQQNQAQSSEKTAQVNQAQQDLNSKQAAHNLQTEEKRAAVDQAQQNLDALKKAYNSQIQEKLAAFQQAQQTLSQSKNAWEFAKIRVKSDESKFERYKQALEEGIISKDRFTEVDQALQESRRVLSSAKSDISQAELRLKEQQKHYQNFIHQAKSEIEQAQLRLKEQQTRYQNFVHQAQSEIEQAQLRLKEQQSAYQSLIQAGKLAVLKSQEQLKDLETQTTTQQAEIAQSSNQIQGLKLQLEQRVLRAPVSGTIFQLPIQRAGAVLQPSQMVAEIAPQGTPFVLKAQMATRESGSLHQEMPVKIKLDAYPFQDYGVVQGRLTKIAPSSKVTETSGGQIATYDLVIHLNQTCIPAANQCIAISPGQTATAEVIVRQRPLIDFVLDPFKKLQKGGLDI